MIAPGDVQTGQKGSLLSNGKGHSSGLRISDFLEECGVFPLEEID